jgi:hypothetical protein
MGLVFLTLVIGVLNLGLGYALAAHLGYAPPSLPDAWEALALRPPAQVPSPQPVAEEMTAASLEALLASRPGDAPGIPPDGQPDGQPYDAGEAAPPAADGPDSGDLEEEAVATVETSILELNQAMVESEAICTELDTRLRGAEGRSDVEAIRQCLTELKEDCETRLARQSAAAERFRDRIGDLGPWCGLGEEMEMASLQQAAQIETALSSLQHMDCAADPEGARWRLLEEIGKLRAARRPLQALVEKLYSSAISLS